MFFNTIHSYAEKTAEDERLYGSLLLQ